VVQQEILRELRLQAPFCEVASIDRPELSLNVHEVHGFDEKVRAVVGLRFQMAGPILVYAALISTLYKAQEEFVRLGLDPLIYHGQLQGNERRRLLREFQSGDAVFMLATPAFGLGINKANLRGVIHFEVPLALESYFQEVGRAGRDGQPAQGHLLFDPDDATIQMDFIKWANPDAGFVNSVYRLISKNPERVAQEGARYLREQMNFYNSRDFRVETSLNLLEKWGSLEPARNRLGFVAANAPSDEDLGSLHTETRIKTQSQKLWQMTDWAQDTSRCRMRRIQSYFGQAAEQDCGRCDVCKTKVSSGL